MRNIHILKLRGQVTHRCRATVAAACISGGDAAGFIIGMSVIIIGVGSGGGGGGSGSGSSDGGGGVIYPYTRLLLHLPLHGGLLGLKLLQPVITTLGG